MSEDEWVAPVVAIESGRQPPWMHLPRTCPLCGEGPLPLEESTGDAFTLRFISHCGGVWLRGPIG